MIRRDFLQAEINKLAQALAKIIDLKTDGNQAEAENLLHKHLQQDFDLDISDLINISSADFEKQLSDQNYPQQKLDLLSQFLFESVSPLQKNPETAVILNHILTIYSFLEQKHHTQSFENLNRKQIIIQFLELDTNGQP